MTTFVIAHFVIAFGFPASLLSTLYLNRSVRPFIESPDVGSGLIECKYLIMHCTPILVGKEMTSERSLCGHLALTWSTVLQVWQRLPVQCGADTIDIVRATSFSVPLRFSVKC